MANVYSNPIHRKWTSPTLPLLYKQGDERKNWWIRAGHNFVDQSRRQIVVGGGGSNTTRNPIQSHKGRRASNIPQPTILPYPFFVCCCWSKGKDHCKPNQTMPRQLPHCSQLVLILLHQDARQKGVPVMLLVQLNDVEVIQANHGKKKVELHFAMVAFFFFLLLFFSALIFLVEFFIKCTSLF